MKIGLSCTLWADGERAGHMDGIGTYTRELWRGLDSIARQSGTLQITPYAFGRDLPQMPCGRPTQLASNFPLHAVMSGLLDLPLARSSAIARDVDLFHAPDHQIPRLKNVRTIASIMDLIPVVHPEWIRSDLRSLKGWLFKTSILKADHVITISEHSKQDMVEHLKINPERISVTPLGVDPVYFERVEPDKKNSVLDKHGLKPGFFLFVGTLQPRKNLPRLVQAFMQLPDAVRKEHPLVIVGRDGWNNEALLPQLAALEQKGEGKWLSYLPRTEVLALLQSAGALLFPSLYEGFGLPVIEAFAAQCPVIASNSTSLPEVAGDAAWLIDPYSTDSIHTAMQEVLNQHALRDKKIQLGVQRAKGYTWEQCAQQTLQVYRKTLGQI